MASFDRNLKDMGHLIRKDDARIRIEIELPPAPDVDFKASVSLMAGTRTKHKFRAGYATTVRTAISRALDNMFPP
jgi:hypothetical protein